jgi:fucose permease
MIELITSTWAFWEKNAARHRADNPPQSDNDGGRTREALKNKVTWLCAIFFFAYVGAEGTQISKHFTLPSLRSLIFFCDKWLWAAGS